jgi:hypothetical protein
VFWIAVVVCYTVWLIVDRVLSNKERLTELEVERAADAHDVLRKRD